ERRGRQRRTRSSNIALMSGSVSVRAIFQYRIVADAVRDGGGAAERARIAKPPLKVATDDSDDLDPQTLRPGIRDHSPSAASNRNPRPPYSRNGFPSLLWVSSECAAS